MCGSRNENSPYNHNHQHTQVLLKMEKMNFILIVTLPSEIVTLFSAANVGLDDLDAARRDLNNPKISSVRLSTDLVYLNKAKLPVIVSGPMLEIRLSEDEARDFGDAFKATLRTSVDLSNVNINALVKGRIYEYERVANVVDEARAVAYYVFDINKFTKKDPKSPK